MADERTFDTQLSTESDSVAVEDFAVEKEPDNEQIDSINPPSNPSDTSDADDTAKASYSNQEETKRTENEGKKSEEDKKEHESDQIGSTNPPSNPSDTSDADDPAEASYFNQEETKSTENDDKKLEGDKAVKKPEDEKFKKIEPPIVAELKDNAFLLKKVGEEYSKVTIEDNQTSKSISIEAESSKWYHGKFYEMEIYVLKKQVENLDKSQWLVAKQKKDIVTEKYKEIKKSIAKEEIDKLIDKKEDDLYSNKSSYLIEIEEIEIKIPEIEKELEEKRMSLENIIRQIEEIINKLIKLTEEIETLGEDHPDKEQKIIEFNKTKEEGDIIYTKKNETKESIQELEQELRKLELRKNEIEGVKGIEEHYNRVEKRAKETRKITKSEKTLKRLVEKYERKIRRKKWKEKLKDGSQFKFEERLGNKITEKQSELDTQTTNYNDLNQEINKTRSSFLSEGEKSFRDDLNLETSDKAPDKKTEDYVKKKTEIREKYTATDQPIQNEVIDPIQFAKDKIATYANVKKPKKKEEDAQGDVQKMSVQETISVFYYLIKGKKSLSPIELRGLRGYLYAYLKSDEEFNAVFGYSDAKVNPDDFFELFKDSKKSFPENIIALFNRFHTNKAERKEDDSITRKKQRKDRNKYKFNYRSREQNKRFTDITSDRKSNVSTIKEQKKRFDAEKSELKQPSLNEDPLFYMMYNNKDFYTDTYRLYYLKMSGDEELTRLMSAIYFKKYFQGKPELAEQFYGVKSFDTPFADSLPSEQFYNYVVKGNKLYSAFHQVLVNGQPTEPFAVEKAFLSAVYTKKVDFKLKNEETKSDGAIGGLKAFSDADIPVGNFLSQLVQGPKMIDRYYSYWKFENKLRNTTDEEEQKELIWEFYNEDVKSQPLNQQIEFNNKTAFWDKYGSPSDDKFSDFQKIYRHGIPKEYLKNKALIHPAQVYYDTLFNMAMKGVKVTPGMGDALEWIKKHKELIDLGKAGIQLLESLIIGSVYVDKSLENIGSSRDFKIRDEEFMFGGIKHQESQKLGLTINDQKKYPMSMFPSGKEIESHLGVGSGTPNLSFGAYYNLLNSQSKDGKDQRRINLDVGMYGQHFSKSPYDEETTPGQIPLTDQFDFLAKNKFNPFPDLNKRDDLFGMETFEKSYQKFPQFNAWNIGAGVKMEHRISPYFSYRAGTQYSHMDTDQQDKTPLDVLSVNTGVTGEYKFPRGMKLSGSVNYGSTIVFGLPTISDDKTVPLMQQYSNDTTQLHTLSGTFEMKNDMLTFTANTLWNFNTASTYSKPSYKVVLKLNNLGFLKSIGSEAIQGEITFMGVPGQMGTPAQGELVGYQHLMLLGLKINPGNFKK